MLNLGIEQPLHVCYCKGYGDHSVLNRHNTLLCHSWLNSLLDSHVSLQRANRLQFLMVLGSV